MRKAINATGGLLAAVEPRAVQRHGKELAQSLLRLGYTLADTERSALIGYTGLVEQVRTHKIPPGSTVVLMITGKGMRPGFEHVEPDAIVPPDYDTSLLAAELQRTAHTRSADPRGRRFRPAD